MSKASRPPVGPPQPYLPFSPHTPPPGKKSRSVSDIIKLVLMLIGGLVVACVGFGAVLNATGSVSPKYAAQTTQAQVSQPAGLLGSVGGDKKQVAIQASAASPLVSTESPTAILPTATVPKVEIPHETLELGQWEITLADVVMKENLGGVQATWLVVHGSITNKGKSHLNWYARTQALCRSANAQS